MSSVGKLKLSIQNRKWRVNNKHNTTNTVNLFNLDQVEVGNGTYGDLYVLTHGIDAKLKIGNYCSIGPQVAFILQSDHSYNHFSTFPFVIASNLLFPHRTLKGNVEK